MAKQIIKRTRTWTTKSGEIKSRTYYYEKTSKGTTRTTKSGKTTKQTFKSVTEKRINLVKSVDEAKDYIKSKSVSLGSDQAQGVLNAIRKGRTLTKAQIDERLSRPIGERGVKDIQNMLRALGYSEEEFAETVGIKQKEVKMGKFEKIGNDIRFTSLAGVVTYFQWDYDAGFIT